MGLVRAYGLLSSAQDEFSPVLANLGILRMPFEPQVEPKGSKAEDVPCWTCRCWVYTAPPVLPGDSTCIPCWIIWRMCAVSPGLHVWEVSKGTAPVCAGSAWVGEARVFL